MADVFHSAAWLTADLAALFGGFLFIPLNVSDTAASVSLIMAKHQVVCARRFRSKTRQSQSPAGSLLFVHSRLSQNC